MDINTQLPTYATLEEGVSHLYQLHKVGYETVSLARALVESPNLPQQLPNERSISALCSVRSLYSLLLARFFALADRSLLPATPTALAHIYNRLRSRLSSLSHD